MCFRDAVGTRDAQSCTTHVELTFFNRPPTSKRLIFCPQISHFSCVNAEHNCCTRTPAPRWILIAHFALASHHMLNAHSNEWISPQKPSIRFFAFHVIKIHLRQATERTHAHCRRLFTHIFRNEFTRKLQSQSKVGISYVCHKNENKIKIRQRTPPHIAHHERG